MTDVPPGLLALAAALALGAAPFAPVKALPAPGWCGKHPLGPSRPMRKHDNDKECPGPCHAACARTRDPAKDEEAG